MSSFSGRVILAGAGDSMVLLVSFLRGVRSAVSTSCGVDRLNDDPRDDRGLYGSFRSRFTVGEIV